MQARFLCVLDPISSKASIVLPQTTHKEEQLDRVDRRILAALQENAALTTIELADVAGLSQAPCWRRLQRLRAKGYIRREVALLDRKRLGWTLQLLVEVKLTSHGRANVAEFTAAMSRHDRVLDCFIILGSVDVILRVLARDIQDYEHFFYEHLSQAPGVREANSMVVLTEAKSTTAIPCSIA